jgi:hypothetical protein
MFSAPTAAVFSQIASSVDTLQHLKVNYLRHSADNLIFSAFKV